MKIIMLDSIAMAYGVLKAGSTYDLSPERAQKMIDRKLARPYDDTLVERPKVAKRVVTSLSHGDKG